MKYCLVILLSAFTLHCLAQKGADQSLTTQEYQNFGFPNPAVRWVGNDVDKAINSLSIIKETKPMALPKADSKKSGACFKKLLSECVMVKLGYPILSDKDKLALMRTSTPLCRTLLRLYSKPEANLAYYSTETAEIYILFVTNNQYQYNFLTSYIKRTLPANQQKPAIDQVNGGYIEMITTVISELQKTTIYKTSDQETISAAIKVSLQQNAANLSISAKAPLKNLLARIGSQKVSVKEKKNINDALASLSKVY